MTLPGIVIVQILRAFSRIGMTFGGAMAGLTLDIFESRVSGLEGAVTGVWHTRQEPSEVLPFWVRLYPFRREDKLLWGFDLDVFS